MNAIYLCAIAHPWIEVIKELESKHNVVPSYIVCWGSDKTNFINSKLRNVHIQTLEEAWKGLGFPKGVNRYVFDEEELKSIAYYELIALKMMDRLDPDGESFPFVNRLYFFRDLLGYWFNIVESNDIDFVVSPSVPHRVFDYALYIVCKIKNIPFVMFQLTPFGSNSILIDDIESMPRLSNTDYSNELPSKAIQNRILKVKSDYEKAVPHYMLKHEANDKKRYTFKPITHTKKLIRSHMLLTTKPNTYWVKSGFSPSGTEYSWVDFYTMKYKRKKIVKEFVQSYNRIVTDALPQKFVLVALHYQPEETSCPTGGAYSDQILMVQLLEQCLHKDINIVIKEHKSQFYDHQESASGRNLDYYKRISKISKRIKFVSVDHDPFELIDQAEAVITISGTIGWESAIRGTPVLVFGRAWYENMPRVFKVKTKEDLMNALPQLAQQKNKDLHDEIMKFHAVLEVSFVLAKHYKAYLDNSDVTMEQSTNNIVNSLSSYLNL